jgi:PAS domain S-box-containing protein
MWVALRFQVREVATGIGVLAMIATWTTTSGLGPFAVGSANESLLLLQTFMITMALTMLPVAALVGEQRRIVAEQEALREAAERERARVEAAGETRSRLAAIVESSDDAIISKTIDGVITSWNRAAEKMFGYSAREAIGRRITLIIPPERLAEEQEVLDKVAGGDRVDPFETIRVTKDGRLVPISITVSPLHESGTIVGASTVARDISARVRGEATTRFLDETGRLLAASLDYEVTLRTLARLAIPTMGELCAVDVVADDGSIERLATAHADPDKERMAQMLMARHPMTLSTRFGVPEVLRTGEGVLHPELPAWLDEPSVRAEEDRALLRALALRSLIVVPMAARGRMLGALTFGSGPARRYGEDDFILAQDLARRAAVALDNARLYRDAQDANRAKDAFLAVLSHELRTPLTSVLGWARMLASGQLDAGRTRQAVETIERNAQLQAQLVNDLLDVSRIVLGKVQLDMRPVDLVPIVEQALEAPARAAAGKGVRVESRLDPAAGRVMGDPLRLEQIVTNIVGNAVKFTPEGGRVEVQLARDGEHVRLVVHDTGVGIEPEALRYIFEAFRQVDSGTSRRHGGLGLGLAIAHNLVELQQGTLIAASEGVGRGATFTVRFPAVAAPSVDERDRGAAAESERIARLRPLEGLRVLVVEDDADSRTLLSSILTYAGAEICAAGGVQEALDIARERPVDALVSDIGMPERDGYDLIDAFRALSPSHRAVPAIAVTALASREDEAAVLAAGFQRYLVKPIDPAALVVAVAKAVGRPA